MNKSEGLAIFLLALSSLVLVSRLLLPTRLEIYIAGQAVEIKQPPTIYQPLDVWIIILASLVIGGSVTFLVGTSWRPKIPEALAKSMAQANVERWRGVLKELQDSGEQRVYELLIQEGGVMFQGSIVEVTGFSRSKVSLILDKLEARGLAERRRRGMSNIVLLK